jgi:hypothetical protein
MRHLRRFGLGIGSVAFSAVLLFWGKYFLIALGVAVCVAIVYGIGSIIESELWPYRGGNEGQLIDLRT